MNDTITIQALNIRTGNVDAVAVVNSIDGGRVFTNYPDGSTEFGLRGPFEMAWGFAQILCRHHVFGSRRINWSDVVERGLVSFRDILAHFPDEFARWRFVGLEKA